MLGIHELYQQYSGLSTGDLSGNQKKQLYALLGSMKPMDIQTIDEHKEYVELIRKLRQASMEDMELFGRKFLATLKSLLSVGEDGVYTNRLRFLYELIQNVDDCDYEDISDCSLEIEFRFDSNPGQIILTYNEKGFTPENVFAITGIAEKSKNISAEKVEIGEKGIGFKSVFGIAQKVRIESGLFSFELSADNFTVPIPKYDDYSYTSGTRLTLEMPAVECMSIYRILEEQYLTEEAMLNQNPILFLNKLTHLRISCGECRYIEFDVQRTEPQEHGELLYEENVMISVDMKNLEDGQNRELKNEVSCYRYTMPITYGRDECMARYGKDISFSERKHHLIAVFPIIESGMENYKGVLYSFLPTQVRMTAPIILHVPYKLGGSREYVDSNNNDAWFTFTTQELIHFLEVVYLDLAHVLKRGVIRYIPSKHNYFFSRDNGKVSCLCINELKGDNICRKKVFFTEDGSFEDITNIISFGIDEQPADPVTVHKLLNIKAKLFIPEYPVDMKWYGCRVIENVPGRLFAYGLEYAPSFDEILSWLEKNIPDLSYYKLLYAYEPLVLSAIHISAIARHGQLWNALIQNVRKQLVEKKEEFPRYTLVRKFSRIDDGAETLLLDVIHNADLDKPFMAYLKRINYKFYVIENPKDFAVAAKNGIVLAKGSELGSFAKLARLFDQQGTFTASIEIRQSSEKLNQVDDSMSNSDYLSLLHGVRKSLMDAFGKRMYHSYIKIIAEAGTDKKRFLSELIQNADDCAYPEGVTPTFKLKLQGSTLITTHNEVGFSKDNVRAITAIGESTKKILLSGEDHSIGEKGVGFKSIFGVADSVEIHSNGFDFTLTSKLPTIPETCEPIDTNDGTTMLFRMRQEVQSAFSYERILQLCTCLRNLKYLEILNHRVTITDKENQRIVSIDGQRHVFERIVHEFRIDDENILASRNSNGKQIDAHQQIVCYIPEKNRGQELLIYSGMPLAIHSNVNLIIDAPFELTTSRENVLHNPWNNIVRDHLYQAILDVMYYKREAGLDILRYVGFHSQNNTISWQNFDDDYLNQYDWKKALQSADILPVLGSEKKVTAIRRRCLLVPEFIARLQRIEEITQYFNGEIIDTIGKNQYSPLLEVIGCVKISGEEIYRFLRKKTLAHISDKEFRDGLYAYLANNQGNTVFGIYKEAALTLPIFPVKKAGFTQYIPYCSNIYTHSTESSKDDYYILNTQIMSLKLADDILSGKGRINELTQEVFDAKYQKVLRTYIENIRRQHSPAQIASFVLNEFKNNRDTFKKCKPLLVGLLPKIPFLMENGTYKTGKKFVNSRGQWYAGDLIRTLVVDSKYKALAEFLECGEVENMHFDDIDFEVKDILDDDIEDLQCDFENFYEIIKKLFDEGLISDEQITKYNLEFAENSNERSDDPYEEFPERPVNNASRLKMHIANAWQKRRNPYVEKQYIVWKPEISMDKDKYSFSMYQSVFNKSKCFCQMCKRLTPKRYIERNDIEKNPVYAWEQMHLNLCLNCSKDYKLLRNNEAVWRRFVKEIMAANVMHVGAIEIPIGEGSVTFTATHLAEIQEIFKNEGWGENAPRRKPILGRSVNDEESGDGA